MLAILLTAGLAISGGYIAHEGMKEWCGSSDDDVVTQSQGERLSPPVINRKTPSALYRRMLETSTVERHVASQIESDEKKSLMAHAEEGSAAVVSIAELASEKNQVMDGLLNQLRIPPDYGDVMIELYRDKTQDVLTRDFAVQHIGLYAETLNMRGKYDADSRESAALRDTLWDAANETRTIVAAAALRALADMAAFDPCIDVRRLDNRLAACVADGTASPAARAMAVQLCGERSIVSARSALEEICADESAPEVLRRSARYSLDSIVRRASGR